jgi:hypothetical protein
MSGFVRRRAIALAGAMLIAVSAAGPVSAIIPPGDSGSYSSCQTISAGYSPVGGWSDTEDWVWDGRLAWDLCVVRTSSGSHYGIARLSAPADLIEQYDRFTGTVNIDIQKCVSGVYTNVGHKDWDVSGYSYASKSNGRYYFSWQQTTSTTSSASYYRVRASGYGAVVPRNGGWYFSLSKSPYGPPPGTNPGVSTTSCRNP